MKADVMSTTVSLVKSIKDLSDNVIKIIQTPIQL